MILLPRRALLAIAAVVDVALHARAAPVAAKALAARLDLPPRHLETLLQTLVRAAILKGVRGPRGGYELARERRRLTMGEIVRVALREEEGALRRRPALVCKVIEPLARDASERFLEAIDRLTIDDLCRRAEESGGASPGEHRPDFTI